MSERVWEERKESVILRDRQRGPLVSTQEEKHTHEIGIREKDVNTDRPRRRRAPHAVSHPRWQGILDVLVLLNESSVSLRLFRTSVLLRGSTTAKAAGDVTT